MGNAGQGAEGRKENKKKQKQRHRDRAEAEQCTGKGEKMGMGLGRKESTGGEETEKGGENLLCPGISPITVSSPVFLFLSVSWLNPQV